MVRKFQVKSGAQTQAKKVICCVNKRSCLTRSGDEWCARSGEEYDVRSEVKRLSRSGKEGYTEGPVKCVAEYCRRSRA